MKSILPFLLFIFTSAIHAQNSDAVHIAEGMPVKISTGSLMYIAGNLKLDATTSDIIPLDNDGVLELTGDLTVNGSAGATDIVAGSASSTGSFLFKTAHNAQQIILAGGASLTGNAALSNVEFDNTSASPEIIITGGNVEVGNAGTLTLTSGRIRLTDNNLIHSNPLPSAFNVPSPGIDAAIITDGTGFFSKYLNTDPAPNYIVPLGAVSGEYTPFILKSWNVTYGANAHVEFSVKNNAHPCISSPGGSSFINRYWRVVPNDIAIISCHVSGQYSPADVSGTETDMSDFKYGPSYTGLCEWANWSTTAASVDPVLHEVNFNGITSFSDFTAGEFAMLPVTWGNLSADAGDCEVQISFHTEAELNNKEFEIQSSASGSAWQTIAVIKPAEQGQTVNRYSYTHKQTASGLILYRIKQTDIDGRSEYSRVISARSTCITSAPSIVLTPNPVTDVMKIKGLTGSNQILILDGLGRMVKTVNNYQPVELIDISALKPALYHVRVVKHGIQLANFKIAKVSK